MGPMLRWFVFTIGFGLLPFGFSVLLDFLHDPVRVRWNNSPELLFFCVMVSAVEMGEILGTFSARTELGRWRSAFLAGAFCALLLGAILAAGLYGIYMDQERAHEVALTTDCARACVESAAARMDGLDFRGNLFRFAVVMSGVVGTVATTAEFLRSRRQS